MPDGLISEIEMQANFSENLSLVFPHIEGLLVGERSSEAAKWFVQTQLQLNCLVRRAELFSVRSGRERFLEVVVFFNVELRLQLYLHLEQMVLFCDIFKM